MKPAQSRILTHGLALLAGAAAVLILSARQRSELRHLRQEVDQWREASAQADVLVRDYGKLRTQYEELASRMPPPNELARLRANASELERLRQELAQIRSAANPSSPNPAPTVVATPEPIPEQAASPPPSIPFTMTGTVGLDFGHTVVTGGWELEPGQHGFVLATPVLLEDGTVMMESRLLSLPDDAVAKAGLTDLLVGSNHSEGYGVTDPDETQALLGSLEGVPGVEILAGPRIVTSPNTEGEISVLRGDQGAGIVLKFNPRFQPDTSSLELDMNVHLTGPFGR